MKTIIEVQKEINEFLTSFVYFKNHFISYQNELFVSFTVAPNNDVMVAGNHSLATYSLHFALKKCFIQNINRNIIKSFSIFINSYGHWSYEFEGKAYESKDSFIVFHSKYNQLPLKVGKKQWKGYGQFTWQQWVHRKKITEIEVWADDFIDGLPPELR